MILGSRSFFKEEVPDVISSKLKLDSLRCGFLLIHSHDFCVIDQNVNLGGEPLDSIDSSTERRLITQVKLDEVDLYSRVDGFDLLEHRLNLAATSAS